MRNAYAKRLCETSLRHALAQQIFTSLSMEHQLFYFSFTRLNEAKRPFGSGPSEHSSAAELSKQPVFGL